MQDVSIRAEGLSKKYNILVGQKRVDEGLAERMTHGLQRMLGRGGSRSISSRREDVWPIRDVSFEIKRGEIVGVIGRNGAGKSTLLKILSRITEPTVGRAEIYGRVGTLLEVGTGFHPELTGRQNVYLSGIILGMKKWEIDSKFDEIVEFSGIEKYIDTPVKRYSSGMYVRLAFAVGAHLESEVLIVDEVLAVGDMQFQKKCLNKMQDIGEHGRTVIFVTHNMQAITRLCQRALFLDKGKLVADGPAHQVVSTYMQTGFNTQAAKEWLDSKTAPGDDMVRLRAVRVRNIEGEVREVIDIRQAFAVEMEFDILQDGVVFTPNFEFRNDAGLVIFEVFDLDPDWRMRTRSIGRYRSTAWIPGNLLSEGTMFVNSCGVSFEPHRLRFKEEEAVAFQIVDSLDGDAARGDFTGEMLGVVRPMLKWTTDFSPNYQLPK
jgi:lipopolysaccharide transport system ATP-binding protein